MYTLRSTPLVIILGLTLLLSCDEDTNIPSDGVTEKNSVVEFKAAELQLAENGSQTELRLKISPAASKAGHVTLMSGRAFNTLFTTTPAASGDVISINIAKGDSVVVLKITPINNFTYGGKKSVPLHISATSVGIIRGTRTMLDVVISDDETESDPEEQVESIANFLVGEEAMIETDDGGTIYDVGLSSPASESGQIKISFAAENGALGNQFTIEPQPIGNNIVLDVAKGSSFVSFAVKPVSNTIITGHVSLSFSISETTGTIVKGTRTTQPLIIKDDELVGLPKGYETIAGGQTDKKWYSYDQEGKISEVKWEQNGIQGTDTYQYNELGQLTSITQSPDRFITYFWSNNKMVRWERTVAGAIKEYAEFDYDQMGNVASSVNYHRQQDGSYKKGFIGVYLYYFDGNLFKSLVYMDGEDPEEPVLVASRAYENYSQFENHFALQIATGLDAQKTLPYRYTYEQNDDVLTYDLSYEFDEEGKQTKRTVSGGETTIYHYY
jgi:antitoxin component YwqK of YwqJK toxin-antitoxin module